MSYSTSSDIGIALGLTFDANSQPTATQVTGIIDQIDSEINLTLIRIGIVGSSITDSDQLNFLKKMSILGAACNIGFTYFGNNNPTSNTQPEFYCTEYKKMLGDVEVLAEMLGGGLDQGLTISNQVTDGSFSENEIDDLFVGNKFKV